jgi:hypothetical protein
VDAMRRTSKFLTIDVILFSLLAGQMAMAATKPELRHVKGFQGIGLSAGTTLEAPCCSLDYTYHLART